MAVNRVASIDQDDLKVVQEAIRLIANAYSDDLEQCACRIVDSCCYVIFTGKDGQTVEVAADIQLGRLMADPVKYVTSDLAFGVGLCWGHKPIAFDDTI